ncbi:hypothetical protein [Ferdinandcohnia sp. Marseille-Q9671]
MLQKIDKTYWVALLVITVILSFILGFIGPQFLHLVLFKHGTTFLVLTPIISNILMFIAFAFFVLFCIGMLFENKAWNYIGILFLIAALGMGYYAGFGNYTLISNNEITFRKSMSESTYNWNDIKEATYSNSTQEPTKKIKLLFENGKVETLEIQKSYVQEVNKIQQKFIQNDIPFK